MTEAETASNVQPQTFVEVAASELKIHLAQVRFTLHLGAVANDSFGELQMVDYRSVCVRFLTSVSSPACCRHWHDTKQLVRQTRVSKLHKSEDLIDF